MVLYKLADFDPNYQDTFQGGDIKGLGVYTETNDEKIGTVNDILVDEEGHFRYLVVDLGFWIFGKKVLLPIGRSRIDYGAGRVYAIGMTKEQAEDLPEFNNDLAVDYDYEEQVRGVYTNPNYAHRSVDKSASLEASAPREASTYANRTVDKSASLEASAPLETSTSLDVSAPLDTTYQTTPPTRTSYTRDNYKYEHEPSLFALNEQDHQTLKLYEERLIANKRRQKTGEVTIGKHIETETTHVAVPVERERVVIERITPKDAGIVVSPDAADFREGEVFRVELHEETPDIHKEAFVREEVRVQKVVEHVTVESEEKIRREELDVNPAGTPIEER